jgi:hypothetical protein
MERGLRARLPDRPAHQARHWRSRHLARVGEPLPLTASVLEMLTALGAGGHEEEDHGGLLQHSEQLASTRLERKQS